MEYWIVPSNDSTFRIADAIKANNGIVDWRQSNNFAVGDSVFIYKAKPEQRVVYRMEVIGVKIPEEDALEQEEFWTDQMAYIDGLGRSIYVRFKLVEEYADDIFSLHHLHEHGFKGNIQSVQHCPEESIDFMLDPYGEVNSDAYDVDYPAADDKLYEGALIQVMANKYERNRDARRKCIELKGSKCQVCGKDFEEAYGEIGKDFIHVHHVVPISKIGKEYKLDIEKDLVPVCPNCHYMLHRSDPPYKVEDLKKKIEEAKLINLHPKKLYRIEDDIDVRRLVFCLLVMDSSISDLQVQKEVIMNFGEKYNEMSLNDWRHIIEDYTPLIREALKGKAREIVLQMKNVADTSRDLGVLLTELHHAKGSYFVELLKEIISHGEFTPVENENNIFFTGGERGEDFSNLLNAARKAVTQGYRVFILPNPKGIRTADFIFERKGVIGLYDLKTIQGKASVSNRLNESIGQTNRVLLNMTTDYNARLLASDIKTFFEKSRDAIEVLVFKGNKAISIKRGLVQNSAFNRLFRKLYEK